MSLVAALLSIITTPRLASSAIRDVAALLRRSGRLSIADHLDSTAELTEGALRLVRDTLAWIPD